LLIDEVETKAEAPCKTKSMLSRELHPIRDQQNQAQKYKCQMTEIRTRNKCSNEQKNGEVEPESLKSYQHTISLTILFHSNKPIPIK
jgi:hypothetical protein